MPETSVEGAHRHVAEDRREPQAQVAEAIEHPVQQEEQTDHAQQADASAAKMF